MTSAPGNIIQNLVLDLHFNGRIDENSARMEAEEMNRLFLKRLEELFDKYDKSDEIIVLDSLDIDILCTSVANWKTEALSVLVANVEKTLQQKSGARAAIPLPMHRLEVLQFYLLHGYLPWWEASTVTKTSTSTGGRIDVFLHAVFEAPAVYLETLLGVIANDSAANRFNDLLDVQNYWSLIRHIARELFGDKDITSAWKKDMELLVAVIRNDIDRSSFRKYYRLSLLLSFARHRDLRNVNEVFSQHACAYLSEKLSDAELRRVRLQKITNSTFRQMFSQVVDRTSKNSKKETPIPGSLPELSNNLEKAGAKHDQGAVIEPNMQQLSVDNAGVVILSPFLPQAFRLMGITEDEIIVNRPKGLALLNYLVTGSTEFREYETVLYKVLLGIEPEVYIDCSYQLTTEDKAEADSLLHAVIRNWAALKATSIDGLRGSFLCREGKLSENKDSQSWKLTVIQKGYDVLLQQLPWGIGMIKHGWMKQLLITEWV